jgi:hypothetical protein
MPYWKLNELIALSLGLDPVHLDLGYGPHRKRHDQIVRAASIGDLPTEGSFRQKVVRPLVAVRWLRNHSIPCPLRLEREVTNHRRKRRSADPESVSDDEIRSLRSENADLKAMLEQKERLIAQLKEALQEAPARSRTTLGVAIYELATILGKWQPEDGKSWSRIISKLSLDPKTTRIVLKEAIEAKERKGG